MNTDSKRWLSLALAAVVFTALAQSSGGDFELTQATLDAGGGDSEGEVFVLVGTIAQPDAGVRQSSGGDFLLSGGFWARSQDDVFHDSYEGP